MAIRTMEEIVSFLNLPEVTAIAVARSSKLDRRTIYRFRDGRALITPKYQARLSMVMNHYEKDKDAYKDRRLSQKGLSKRKRSIFRRLKKLKSIYFKVHLHQAPYIPLTWVDVARFEYYLKFRIIMKWGKNLGLFLEDCKGVDYWWAKINLAEKRGLRDDEWREAR